MASVDSVSCMQPGTVRHEHVSSMALRYQQHMGQTRPAPHLQQAWQQASCQASAQQAGAASGLHQPPPPPLPGCLPGPWRPQQLQRHHHHALHQPETCPACCQCLAGAASGWLSCERCWKPGACPAQAAAARRQPCLQGGGAQQGVSSRYGMPAYQDLQAGRQAASRRHPVNSTEAGIQGQRCRRWRSPAVVGKSSLLVTVVGRAAGCCCCCCIRAANLPGCTAPGL